MVLSDLLVAQNEPRSAELHARTALESAAPSNRTKADALGTLALVLLDRPMESLMAAVQAIELLQSVGGATDGEARILLAHALALDALGHDEPARQAITKAYDRLLSKAGKLNDDDRRHRFLHGIREHSRTLELAAKYEIGSGPA